MIGSTSLLRPTAARLDWETPPPIFEKYASRFAFTLDVCATPENAKCERYFTAADDGLAQDWGSHTCWMNPPYGRAIAVWMKKAYEASQAGATIVCFVPARTDTRWWHDYALRGEYEFLKGRVSFPRSDGKRSTAPFPSAIVVFRPRCHACGNPVARGAAA
jgi:phage N-6-adenine-methyltransferase